MRSPPSSWTAKLAFRQARLPLKLLLNLSLGGALFCAFASGASAEEDDRVYYAAVRTTDHAGKLGYTASGVLAATTAFGWS